ncbi:acyltransferase family protein [Nocardioides sp. CBS4Y-1]|uniref:Acyltransferase family protein n=1 Tax=Nocardioides acrostichi TaxID=2784339 RepID=A0A930YEG3_9ACTN|nr:acyltransferase family protein [Nocardioides acrostichi]
MVEVEAAVDAEVEAQKSQGLDPVLAAYRLLRAYFRHELTGSEHVPAGGALLVSNHSGGFMAMDLPLIASGLASGLGVKRRIVTLAHTAIFAGPWGAMFAKLGLIEATREAAHEALTSGELTLVFPGGVHDVLRPTRDANVIDFAGRIGYVRTALEAGVPIVPVVSIGGQETQLFLTRGEPIAELLRLDKLLRARAFPISIGFPFGISIGTPINIPLPAKIKTRILEPVDPAAFESPEETDVEVRRRMQEAIDEMADERRFPFLG